MYRHYICIDHIWVKKKTQRWRKSNQNTKDMGWAITWSPHSGAQVQGQLHAFLWCLFEIYLNHIKLDIKMCRHIHHSKWYAGALLSESPTLTIGLENRAQIRLIIYNPVRGEQTFLLEQFKLQDWYWSPRARGLTERRRQPGRVASRCLLPGFLRRRFRVCVVERRSVLFHTGWFLYWSSVPQ